jgi:hypothetical protein
MGISLQTYFENFDYNSQNVLSNNSSLLESSKKNLPINIKKDSLRVCTDMQRL